ncbi:MAG: Ig-like domain-containing protein [Rivularia sp. (in: cyanobacteria)]
MSYSIQEPYSQTKEDNYDFLLSVDSHQDGLLVGNLDSTNLTFSYNSNLTVSRSDSSSPIPYFPTNTVDTNSVFPQQVSTPADGKLLGDTIIVPGRVGERTTLRFKWTEREAVYNNEAGVFVVDELGQVDGIAPGEAGYPQAAIASSSRQIIFSSGEGTGAQRELTFEAGERLGFYIIQNNTTDQWLLLNPENNLEKGLLAFFSIENVNPDKFDHVFTQTPNNALVQFFWEDLTGGGNKDFNDVVFTISESRKALNVPGETGQKVTAKFTWTDREAAFNNELGLFIVDDTTGRIGNFLPPDPGYARAALNNISRRIIFASGETEGAVKNLELASGEYIGFYLIQNSTTEHFLQQNPENKSGNGPSAFFLFPGANPDQFDHVVELPPDQFAWEDLTGGGDKDFDDLVFRYEFGSPIGDGNPEPDQNSPVITARLVRDTAPGGLTNTDKITRDPSITGKVTDKNPITEFLAGINNTPTVSILDALQADGSFSLSPERLNQIFGANLADGSYTVNLQAKDQFGNISSTFGVTFTLDTQVQSPILDLAADSDSGISNIDNITRDRTPTITGNTESGAVVQLYNGSTLLGETTANSTSIWQITAGELSYGTQNFTAIATDIAGNVSSPSLPLNVVIDTVNPVINLTDPIDTTPLQTGAKLTGSVDGTGSGIAAVSYRFDNLPEIPLIFNAGGEFDQVIDFTGIDNGERAFTITTTDIAGNITTSQLNLTIANGSGVENNAPEIISQPETDYIILRNSNAQIKEIELGTTQTGLAEIQGQTFLNFDRDGLRSREAALDGFVVELVNSTTGEVVGTQITRSFDVNGDGKLDPFAEQGLYKFTNLQAGSYQARLVSQDGWNLTLPASSTYDFTLNGGDIANSIGNLLNSIDYSSFGTILAQTNPTTADRFNFTGREFDK